MKDLYEEQLQKMRAEWKAYPHRRPILEHVAKAIKQKQKEYQELKENVKELLWNGNVLIAEETLKANTSEFTATTAQEKKHISVIGDPQLKKI